MNRKPVDIESLPILIPLLLGVPKNAISVVNDGVRGYTGIRITRRDEKHITFWYDWKTSKLQLLEVDSRHGKTWTQRQAIDLCIQLEQFAPTYGCHVALTGGCLYKDGPRKDVDIMVYRIRQVERMELSGLIMRICADLGVMKTELHGWVTKLHLADGRCIDLFDPTCEDGEYPEDGSTIPSVDLKGSPLDNLGDKWQSDLTHFD